VPIKLAAKVDQAVPEYSEEQVRPRLNEPGVEFVGELGRRKKANLSVQPARWCFRTTGLSLSA
jgi:hypothetical protein